MAQGSEYVMAGIEAEAESSRLGLLEACRDPGSIRRLESLGVGAGWRCLEVGAGRGSIARWLSERIGPTGSVVAVDIDPRFLRDVPENVEVRRLDIREEEVEPGAYDLVHCRALLMHLPDPAGTVGRFAAALSPGGWLLAEEGDYGLSHYGGHPDAEELNERARRIYETLAEVGVFNSRFGRTLPALLLAGGFERCDSEIETRVSRPGDPDYEFARATALESVPGLIAAGLMEDSDVDRLESYFEHPDSVITGASVVSAWGKKPQ
jgi:SAM-dependent methyltransferase